MDAARSSAGPVPLPGRDRHLAILAAALADVRGGQRSVVVVDGDAGIGKTSLVRGALAGEPSVLVWASADESEAELDFAIVDQLARAAPLAAADRDALLGEIGGEPLRIGAALVALVDGLDLDPARPLVVVVDDAQWADAASLQAIAFAARRLQRDPVLLCVIARTDGLDRLPDGLVRLADGAGVRLHVDALDAGAVRELAEQVSGHPVSTSAAKRLADHTLGNPLHLRTLLTELPSAVLADEDLPAPRSFATLVLARLAATSKPTERLVSAVAVLGDPAPLAVAGEMANLADPLAALDEAVEAGLLEPGRMHDGTGISVTFSHPLVRAAVLGDLPPGRRMELHRSAGALLAGANGLRHRLLGAVGGDAELYAEAVESASADATAGAHGSAAAMFRHAVRVAGSTPQRERALLDAVDQLLMAGRLDDAVAMQPAVEAASPSPRRSYLRGRFAYIAGPRRVARDHLDEAWQALVRQAGGVDGMVDLPLDDRRLAGRTAAMLATVAVDRAAGDVAAGWCRQALRLAPLHAALSSTAHMLAGAYGAAGRLAEGIVELDALCEGQPREASPDDGPVVADTRSARGLLRLWAHDLPGAVDDLQRSLHAATTCGTFVARETVRSYLAEVRYRQGCWDDAIHLAGLSSSLVDDSEQRWMAALPHATLARPLAARGDERAADHIDRAVAAAEAVGGGVLLTLTRVAAMEVAACARDHDRVVELGAIIPDDERGTVDERISAWRATYVESLVALGRLDEATTVARHLGAQVTTPLMANDLGRCELALASATPDGGDRDPEELVAASLAASVDAVGPYPRARLELALGRALRRRGERRRAMELLITARGRFEALGAAPWLEQADREVAAGGLRPARRRPGAGTALTPQEQAVAHLVARGLTNREAATELIISAKTVEHHLSRIYAKLGVRSRTELARVLGPRP